MSDQENAKVKGSWTSENLESAKTYLEGVEKALMKHMPDSSGFIPNNTMPENMKSLAVQLRNSTVWDYPLLPSALLTYQQIASSREWIVSGKADMAARAVDWLNGTSMYDPSSGIIRYGFQNYLKQRVLDYLILGQTMFAVKKKRNTSAEQFEYIDPSLISFKKPKGYKKGNYIPRNQKVWKNDDGRVFSAEELFIDSPVPIGVSRYVPPVFFILPMASLATLVFNHDSDLLDGRKIRELTLVDSSIAEAVEQGYQIVAALHSGASISDVGAPVIPVNNMSGEKLVDKITTLGLSKLPENFDRRELMDMYASVIAATLGISIRHFWTPESGGSTNKALEVVQEARQQLKGPSAFVRAEQRLINNSGVLKRFKKDEYVPRFAFIEEVDISTKKANATVLKSLAETFAILKTNFGNAINPHDYLAMIQDWGVLTYDINLQDIEIEPEPVQTQPQFDENGQPIEQQPQQQQEATVVSTEDRPKVETSDPSPNSFIRSKELDYDEVKINQDGQVVERRRKVFSLPEHIYKTSSNGINGQSSEDLIDQFINHALEKAKAAEVE